MSKTANPATTAMLMGAMHVAPCAVRAGDGGYAPAATHQLAPPQATVAGRILQTETMRQSIKHRQYQGHSGYGPPPVQLHTQHRHIAD